MAKVFPEITMTGMGVELSLYPFENVVPEGADATKFSVILDNGFTSICIAETNTYEIATEVIQCYMTACAALGFELDSVN